MATKRTSSSKTNARRRGAALVEAAVVMPVVVIFYGLMVFVYNEYDLKQTLVSESRFQAFRSTLHECSLSNVEKPNYNIERMPGYDNLGGYPYVPGIINGASMRTFISERGMMAQTITTGLATNAPLSQVVRTKNLRSESRVYCNPRDINQIAGPADEERPQAMTSTLRLFNAVMGDVLSYFIANF